MKVARLTRVPIGNNQATGHTIALPEIPGKGIRIHQLSVSLASGTSTYDDDPWVLEFGLTHNLLSSGRASRDSQSYAIHNSTHALDAASEDLYVRLSFDVPAWGIEVGGSQRWLMFQTGDDNGFWSVRLYYELFQMPVVEWRALHQQTVIGSGGTEVPG